MTALAGKLQSESQGLKSYLEKFEAGRQHPKPGTIPGPMDEEMGEGGPRNMAWNKAGVSFPTNRPDA